MRIFCKTAKIKYVSENSKIIRTFANVKPGKTIPMLNIFLIIRNIIKNLLKSYRYLNTTNWQEVCPQMKKTINSVIY